MHASHPYARWFPRKWLKKSPNCRRQKQLESILQASLDQPLQTQPSVSYRVVGYVKALEQKSSYMYDFVDGCKQEHLENLLCSEQTVPQDSLLRHDRFKRLCKTIHDRNEAMVLQRITQLIVPSAATLAIYGADHLDHLYESINEGWHKTISFLGSPPNPDYSVGFAQSAFTDQQLEKLKPFIGSDLSNSDATFFMATMDMYFPFLTCEVKCGAVGLDIADRQNAQSGSIAVRGVVELHRAAKREKELNGEILAFSISHNNSSVRIYGHYAIIAEDKDTFYRHTLRDFSFTAQDGKKKLVAYTFTRNFYDIWMPIHHKRICSAIDDLPLDLDHSQSGSLPESRSQSTRPSTPRRSQRIKEKQPGRYSRGT